MTAVSAEPVTLDNCEREPIHIPGAIQPHGVLLGVDGGIVKRISANAGDVLGVPAGELLGRPVAFAFDAQPPVDLQAAQEHAPFRVVTRRGAECTAVAHRSNDTTIVELEVGWPSSSGSFDPRLRASVRRLRQARDVATLHEVVAEEVRTLTGFDRVMVYRFDPAWNGQVVAEAKREDLEPFLGLHYPASDIPAQARHLYTENWLRIIPEISYARVPLLETEAAVASGPLDLSHAHLRSVSPIHVEYLQNMGVTASMSLSLVVDGKLAGLIACHHYAGPRVLSQVTRETATFLAQTLSWHLGTLDAAQVAARTERVRSNEAAVVRAMSAGEDFLEGLARSPLLALCEADGAAVVLEEGTRLVGDAPPPEAVKAIVAWLVAKGDETFATDHLAHHLEGAEAWADTAAGLLAVCIARDLGEYLLWFRRPTERTVDWAGDPRKQVTQVPGQPPRLSPRGSFALWRETVRGRSVPWEPWQVETASNVRRVLLGGARRRAATLRTLNDRLVEADRAKDTFIAMVSHELRTPLNAINGWASLLANGSVGKERMPHAFTVIERNTEALRSLVEDLLDVARFASGKVSLDVDEVDLAPIVEGAIEVVSLSAAAKRIRFERIIATKGTVVLGDAGRLRQIVTNLLSNAVKFTPKEATIHVTLRRSESEAEIVVRDEGKGITAEFLPHVFEIFQQHDGGIDRRSKGLGLGLAIAKKLVELHGGSITAASDGEQRGATFVVRLPLLPVNQASPATPRTPAFIPRLEGVRLLVVEDEDDSRDLVCQVFEQHGAQVEVVADAESALGVLTRQAFDVIVSDIGLPGMNGLDMMRELRGRTREQGGETPAVALSAYARAADRTNAMLAGFASHLTKPADFAELITLVASVSKRLPRQPPSSGRR